MANSMRGEVELLICGERHVLRFTLGALRELKEQFKAANLVDLFKDASSWGPEELTALFVAGLRRGSMPDATFEQIEELLVMQELPQYAEALSAALNASTVGKTTLPARKAAPPDDPTIEAEASTSSS